MAAACGQPAPRKRRQRLPLGEAGIGIGSSEPIPMTDEGRPAPHYLGYVGEIAMGLTLIRLFQFALPWGKLENPPSPRGRLWYDKQPFPSQYIIQHFGGECGDLVGKVMQIQNCEDINNGDVGYITSITGTQSESVVRIDFGDGRVVDYENGDLDMLDLAYACTVHKSQGDEFKSVIINLQSAHSVMLVRPLIYTAITRAKEKVLIVGERRALCTAIRRIDTEQRGTKLAQRINDFSK